MWQICNPRRCGTSSKWKLWLLFWGDCSHWRQSFCFFYFFLFILTVLSATRPVKNTKWGCECLFITSTSTPASSPATISATTSRSILLLLVHLLGLGDLQLALWERQSHFKTGCNKGGKCDERQNGFVAQKTFWQQETCSWIHDSFILDFIKYLHTVFMCKVTTGIRYMWRSRL